MLAWTYAISGLIMDFAGVGPSPGGAAGIPNDSVGLEQMS